MKLGKLIEARESIAKLAKIDDIPLKISYQLSKEIKKAADEIEIFFSKRDALIKKLGKDNGDGTFKIEQNTEEFTLFQKEMVELYEVDTDIEFTPIPEEVILNSSCKLSATDLLLIEFMIQK